MNWHDLRSWLVFGLSCIALTLSVLLQATPVASQLSPTQPRFEYRVIEVPPDTHSIQTALDEYGHAGWELAAFEVNCRRRG
jgi:hypothetical protein